jgi:hypothetical protein
MVSQPVVNMCILSGSISENISRKKETGNTGQLKKKVTLSHVNNEVTSEPTITHYTTVMKTLEVCL